MNKETEDKVKEYLSKIRLCSTYIETYLTKDSLGKAVDNDTAKRNNDEIKRCALKLFNLLFSNQ